MLAAHRRPQLRPRRQMLLLTKIPCTPQQSVAVTATDATWHNSVVSKTYQWQSAGVNATGSGATTLTYTPVAGDVGNTLTITVTATNTGGTTAASTSAVSATVTSGAAVPVNSVLPAVTGTTTVGQTLTTTNGTWTNTPTGYSRQWYRSYNGGSRSAISSAAGSTYVLVVADQGNAITCD